MTKTETPSPVIDGCTLSFPAPHVLLVTITREKQMNSITSALHWQMHNVFQWYDKEPTLRAAVITGSGNRAFCAGQDLIELNSRRKNSTGESGTDGPLLSTHPPGGFAGLSRRFGRKPVIAAVNGYALGGGFEITLNCDMVVAAPHAKFGLPEAMRGIYAAAGGLPRIMRTTGLHIASEIAMSGRQLSAEEALKYNLVNKISQSSETVVEEAVEMATKVAGLSPDAIIITRAGLREAWETASVERAYQLIDDKMREKLYASENTAEGLAAFAEKRQPQWRASKL